MEVGGKPKGDKSSVGTETEPLCLQNTQKQPQCTQAKMVADTYKHIHIHTCIYAKQNTWGVKSARSSIANRYACVGSILMFTVPGHEKFLHVIVTFAFAG